MIFDFARWERNEHLLNRMTLEQLNRAYITYPGIHIYAVLFTLCSALALWVGGDLLAALLAAATIIIAYPLIWYGLHRFVLHSRFLYKFEATSALWKRIHYDHHENPDDMSVLFGALRTTLPTIILIGAPVGYAVGGMMGLFAACSAGLAATAFYEYVHCIQHLRFMPKNRHLQKLKRLHLLHHFHDEAGNYGITNFTVDHLFGTFYPDAAGRERSATVRNLGYDLKTSERYPWVRALTELKNGERQENTGATG
jgi:sterol desaturase/sphingolipid hydroxylase (fatty acid hydroxylase superfamily)